LSAGLDRRGLAAALAAFFIWGLSPIFFKALGWMSAAEIVSQRVLWSVPLLAIWLALSQGFGGVRAALRSPRLLGLLCFTTLCTGGNWLLYVWAVVHGRTVEASLGYFINPLLNVALGALVLRERLRPLQWLAVAMACIGVVWRVLTLGHLPWIALAVAGTFGAYGLLRKQAPIDAVNGLFIETVIALPVAVGYLLWATQHAAQHPPVDALHRLMLPAAGLITTVPLALFASGARRLPLSTLGLAQYLAPTLQFLCAILVLGEALGPGELWSFAFIWAGLAVYSWDAFRRR